MSITKIGTVIELLSLSLTFKLNVMKKYLLPIAFFLSINLGFSQERNHHHNHQNNNAYHYNNHCNNTYQEVNNLILQLPSIPVQIWIDQNWIGNFSQNYEAQLPAGRHAISIRIAQSRRGSQVIYRDIFNGFILIKPNSQLLGNCVNFKLPIQFSEIPLYNSFEYSYSSNYPQQNHCQQDNQSFQYFLQSVQSCWFDSEKSALIEHYISSNQLSSGEIYQLLAELDYESSRLQMAKMAYAHCYDPQNYYSIFNLFSFGSSKVELSKFIGRC
jgi:hypothetical protein